jgi:hypothetical protein
MFNASTCAEKFQSLPKCLDSIRLAEQGPVWNVERRSAAHDICWALRDGDTHGTSGEDVRKKVNSLVSNMWNLDREVLAAVSLGGP